MKLIQELSQVTEGRMKEVLIDLIDRAIDKVDTYDMEYEAACKEIAKKVHEMEKFGAEVDNDFLMSLIKDMYSEADHKDVVKEDEEDDDEDKVIAKADEFTLMLDADEQVHLLDGEKTVRVSMPLIIWKQLTRA